MSKCKIYKGNDENGNAIFEEIESVIPPEIKQKRKDLIIEYMRRYYDADDEQAIINNWIEVRDNEATPPPADIIERRTKAYRKYQKIRKEAKSYADSIVGSSED